MLEKQYESFLVDKLKKWLGSSHTLVAGTRYQFKSPDPANSKRLIASLIDASHGVIIFENQSHHYISINGVKLIFAGHIENYDIDHNCYTENYVSMLRDAIASQQGPLKDCALLIIHNSLLDTLVNSAFDLASVDSVWSPNVIKSYLEDLITDTQRYRVQSECLLDHHARFIEFDGASMFGFRELYDAIASDGDLRFDELRLFPDEIILKSDDKKHVEKRLDMNRSLMERISYELEHYPNELEERLTEFGSSFIKKTFAEPLTDWKNIDYASYLAEIETQKNQELNLIGIDGDMFSEMHVRSKGRSAAAKRQIHIIISIPDDRDSAEFSIKFDGIKLNKNDLVIRPSKMERKISLKGDNRLNRTAFKITCNNQDEPQYFTLRLQRDRSREKFQFHCVVVKQNDFDFEEIKDRFIVKPTKKTIMLHTNEQQIKLCKSEGETYSIKDSGQQVDLTAYSAVDFSKIYEDSDDIDFSAISGMSTINLKVVGESKSTHLILPQIFDQERYRDLFDDDSSNGVYKLATGTVVIDNHESVPIILRKKLLKIEKEFVDDEIINWNYDTDTGKDIEDLKKLGLFSIVTPLTKLFDYLNSNKTLPSLCSWGPEFTDIVNEYTSAIHAYLSSIKSNHTLSEANRLVVGIGFTTFEEQAYLTPYHPLVLSYYCSLVESIRKDESDSFSKLPNVTLRRLNPRGLLPYVHDPVTGYSYTTTVDENPMWLRIVSRENSSFDFIENLVRDKVDEFVSTFGDLFEQAHDAPLIINSVNNGFNRELFMGLIAYFKKNLNNSRKIHVNLYDSEFSECEFDEFAELGSYELIKRRYEIDKGKGKNRENADTVIDLLRINLTFSKFEHDSVSEQNYAHLTFFKNNQRIDAVSNDMDAHLSGMACDGLLNGETSVNENDQYFTAFGVNGVKTSDLKHVELARLIGRLIKPALSPQENYSDQSAIRLAVSGDFVNLLDRSYDSSLWTTIIDPKVTLSFFSESRGMMLIHYSDQYTSSSGYDAITVTRRADLYKRVLGDSESNLINEFNAFNGEWLLKLVTDPKKEKEAKRGIVGAYKVVSSLLSESDITWIPLSVAEMIRVAGNIGLSMSDSDFSRYNIGIKKGAISDDILFAGFKDDSLYLLPVEVKSGARPDYKKARKQALELKLFMEDGLLLGPTLKAKLFRSLFIRQILLQIEKYQLYNVFSDQYFDKFLSKRELWLSGNYDIAQLDEYPSAMVVAHVSNIYEQKYELIEDVLQIELPHGFLSQFVHAPHNQIKSLIVDKNLLSVDRRYFLGGSVWNRKGEIGTPTAKFELPEVEEVIEKSTQTDPICNEDNSHDLPRPIVREPLKIKFGRDIVTSSPIYWEPTNTNVLFNTNTGIIGTMGTGKTQFTKSMVTQIHRQKENNIEGKEIGILIFDYKADYVKEDFVKATNAKVLKLYNLPFNPFALFGNKPMLPRHTANTFKATLSKAFSLGVKQESKISNLVMEAYINVGIDPRDETTWDRPCPTLNDVWDIYRSQEKVTKDSLYAALEELSGLDIFEADTNKTKTLFDLVQGVTVIDLSGYDPKTQNLVVALTLDLFYIQMQQQGSSKLEGDFRQVNKFVLVDEADNFMSQNFESLKKILKEGREFGVGTILSTQELTHFKTKENDYSNLILTWVIHQVANLKNQDIKSIFNTNSKSEEEEHMSHIRTLEKHYSLCIDGKKKITKIEDLAFWQIADD